MIFRQRQPEKRSPGAIAVSVVLHVLVGAVLLRAVVGSARVAEWLVGPERAAKKEQVQYVAVRPPVFTPSGGGSERSATTPNGTTPPRSALVAPTSVPTTLPTPTGGRGGSGGGTGTGQGTGSGSGTARGIVPEYDPRLYPGAPDEVRVVRTPKERLDSVIAQRFAQAADSAAANPASRVSEDGRADLSFKVGGKEYGWTQRGIMLGKFHLPAPLLALLPLNRVGGNPTSLMRAEDPWRMRNQIQSAAQVAINAESFNDRVKRIRERRDRERREAREGQPQTPTAPPVPVLPDR